MTLPLSKPQVGGTGWHTNYWQMVDLWNSIDERIRDLIGATIIAGVGIDSVVNDAGDTVTLNATAGADDESIQDMISTFLVAGNNVVLTYDDAGHTLTIDANSNSETIRDTIATALVAGSGVTITVDDPGNTITIAAATDGGGGVRPVDHGLVSWNFDPVIVQNAQALSTGVMYVTKFRLDTAKSLTGLPSYISSTAGAGLSNCYAALLSTAGARLAVSADLSTSWQSTGLKANAFATPYSATPGYYYGVFLAGGATTQPTWLRGGNNVGVNFNLTGSGLRFATLGSALTAVPTTNDLSTMAALNTPIFMGVSGT